MKLCRHAKVTDIDVVKYYRFFRTSTFFRNLLVISKHMFRGQERHPPFCWDSVVMGSWHGRSWFISFEFRWTQWNSSKYYKSRLRHGSLAEDYNKTTRAPITFSPPASSLYDVCCVLLETLEWRSHLLNECVITSPAEAIKEATRLISRPSPVGAADLP
jgi:hypothetical protein